MGVTVTLSTDELAQVKQLTQIERTKPVSVVAPRTRSSRADGPTITV